MRTVVFYNFCLFLPPVDTMKNITAIASILLLVSAAQCQKLKQYCKFSPRHTLCQTTGLGKTCGSNIYTRGVTEKEAAVIVAQHNQLRAMVALGQEKRGAPGPQPKAADMVQMVRLVKIIYLQS